MKGVKEMENRPYYSKITGKIYKNVNMPKDVASELKGSTLMWYKKDGKIYAEVLENEDN